LTSATTIPHNVIQCGSEKHGNRIFAARRFYENGVHVGKFTEGSNEMCLSFGGKELLVGPFEVLVGNPAAVKWIDAHGELDCLDGNFRGEVLVAGGYENGYPLFVAQALHEGGVHVGKAGPKLRGCNFGYGGKEICAVDYRVLAFVRV
jgi:hypothetical protein